MGSESFDMPHIQLHQYERGKDVTSIPSQGRRQDEKSNALMEVLRSSIPRFLQMAKLPP